jgi:O-Antigen ligase
MLSAREAAPRRADLAVASGAVLVAVAAVAVLAQGSQLLRGAVVGGTVLAALVALALVRYDAAVVFGFALLGFVRAEPAPSDLVFSVVVAVAVVTGRARLERAPFAPVALVGGLLVLGLLSVRSALDLSVASRYLAISVYLGVLFFWLLAYVDSSRRARLIVVGYLFAALVSAVLGTLPFLIDSPALDLFTTEGGFRAQALFKDPNVYGPFLVPALLILLEELLNPRLFALSRATKLVFILVLSVGLVLSYSRAAWINLGIGVAVLLVVSLLRPKGTASLKVVLATLVGILALLVPLIAVTGAGGLIEDRARFQAYDVERFAAQREGLELGMRHPLGVGPGQFDFHAVIGAHSLYVRVLAEQGPLGLFLLLLLLALTFAVAASNAIAGRDTFGIGSAALLASLCGLFVNSAVVDTLHWRHLWIVLALVWVGWCRSQRDPRTSASSLAARS